MHRVAVAGMDGVGKTTTLSEVCRRLSHRYSITKVGRPIFRWNAGKKEPLHQKIISTIDRIHHWLDLIGFRPLISLHNFMFVFWQGSVERRLALEDPDLMISERCMIIDPAVYASLYVPGQRASSPSHRLRRSRAVSRLPYRELVFYLTAPVDVCMERISYRLAAEKGNAAVLRQRWRHPHENHEALQFLSGEYRRVLEVAWQEQGFTVVEIDTEHLSPGQVEKVLQDHLEALLEDRLPPGWIRLPEK